MAFAIRWRLPFFCACVAAFGCTAAAGVVLFPGTSGAGKAIALAAGGELLLAGILHFLLDRSVFRPASRWAARFASTDDPGPEPAPGWLAPLTTEASAARSRIADSLSLEVRRAEERLRQVERLRSDLEATKSHLLAKVHDLHSIFEVSTAIAGSLDTEELFRILPERVMRTLGLNDFYILLYNPETRMLVCRSSASSTGGMPPGQDIAPGQGVSGRVFSTGEAVYIPDVRNSPEFLYYGGTRMDVRSFMCVPLMSKGKVLGVLNVNHPDPNAFDAESLATMRVLATYIATAIENAELFQFVKTLAEKDSLTLLNNHGAFHERLSVELERADRYAHFLSVLMVDLDGFKYINDNYGHLAGDRILLMTAGVLCAHLRKSDIAARYGGDEFAVILPETDLTAAATIAERISVGISQIRLETEKGDVVSFTASIGYATCPPHSPARGSLLDAADRLMFESKRRGRGGVQGEQI